jgi:hypothetical protein
MRATGGAKVSPWAWLVSGSAASPLAMAASPACSAAAGRVGPPSKPLRFTHQQHVSEQRDVHLLPKRDHGRYGAMVR